MAHFDHIEAHVSDITRYCKFLMALFEGGTFEVISPTGTSMYTSPDGVRIEVKRKKIEGEPSAVGFCNPCLRRSDPKKLLSSLKLQIVSEQDSPSGKVYFFNDFEGVTWHIKDLPE
jgi:hypothetical protein